MKNMFNAIDTAEMIKRIESLTPAAQPNWGKMNVDQMLAHCNVTYELVFEDLHAKPNVFKKLILKLFVKDIVVGDKPYKKNGQTAPEFVIKDNRKFETEKKRLIDYINKTQQLGENFFEGKESLSFGVLTIKEWNTMFAKHLDHHLTQFGV
ncbi:DUF1569 domain-containing protein [Wenyingzhuangia sp. 2_MG-2023]|uniref:DUF1569 domain-containing protein n=1 Tax=Wenyingzhuangia sp. 2_MG-2023 TaxID=3062639 RepID=UPI0026E17EE0|nr:DUF1569 domain-containing protein [Wenyingzhuangia sp. 2_MG-2023]MDO6737996.1 DUF1569 domain-containing protein [Wenyingzhuangia sp. 2_MG-2023]MDO6802651.1 DUF1569 domain-containing protein [Wenyingzhuangia sp. 1_MG-2023]